MLRTGKQATTVGWRVGCSRSHHRSPPPSLPPALAFRGVVRTSIMTTNPSPKLGVSHGDISSPTNNVNDTLGSPLPASSLRGWTLAPGRAGARMQLQGILPFEMYAIVSGWNCV